MRIDMRNTPSFSKSYGLSLNTIAGGLNIRDQGYLVAADESPCIRNLQWREGLLQTRPAQKTAVNLYTDGPFTGAQVLGATDFQFKGYTFFHVGNGFQCLEFPATEDSEPLVVPYNSDFEQSNVPGNRGTFFRYQSHLFYKNEGGFFEIRYDKDYAGAATAESSVISFAASGTITEETGFEIYAHVQHVGVDNWSKVTNSAALPLSREFLIVRKVGTELRALLAEMTGPKTFQFSFVPILLTNGQLYANVMPTTWNILTGPTIVEEYDGAIEFLRNRDDRDPTNADPAYRAGVLSVADSSLTILPPTFDRSGETVSPESYWFLSSHDATYGFQITNALLRDDGEPDALSLTVTPGIPYSKAPFFYQAVNELVELEDEPPVIVINASPTNGSGTMYQPENRLCSKKTVWYNAVAGVTDYQLPVTNIDGITKVLVNGVAQEYSTQYTFNAVTGVVTFIAAPDPGNPPANNTVQITYQKRNPDALNAVLGCKYATVASGGDAVQYIVLGGNKVQPDAIFWNANDELAVTPYYFPMSCYNLIGTRGDTVTGFGSQYNDTLVFTTESVGKLSYTIETVDGRNTPSFGYARVNDKIGCDLPWTIQTVQNNVVFCNTYHGAHIVWSSSAAYENNIQCLSEKINPDGWSVGVDIRGLLYDVQNSPTDVVCYDDDDRYWICANGKVYVWDYEISTYADPAWFYWTGINPACFFKDAYHSIYNVTSGGKVLRFGTGSSDDGVAIPQFYRSPTMHFNAYERLKNVEELTLTVRADVNSSMTLTYRTDYENREDLTPIVVHSATPIPTSGTIESQFNKVFVAKRKPGCRHVRQFAFELESRGVAGMALVSADIFYRFTGPERGMIYHPNTVGPVGP